MIFRIGWGYNSKKKVFRWWCIVVCYLLIYVLLPCLLLFCLMFCGFIFCSNLRYWMQYCSIWYTDMKKFAVILLESWVGYSFQFLNTIREFVRRYRSVFKKLLLRILIYVALYLFKKSYLCGKFTDWDKLSIRQIFNRNKVKY